MARILIVDDDPRSRELLRHLLKRRKHEILEAENGEEGLRESRTMHPDLIFLDIRLPRINGFDVCKEIKANPSTAGIPVVMLTGCEQDIQATFGRQCGAEEYIVKPFEPAAALKTVDKILASRKLKSEPSILMITFQKLLTFFKTHP